MKKIIILFSAIILGILSFGIANAATLPYLKLGTVNYAVSYYGEPLKSQVLNWEAKVTDFFIGGASPKAFSANNFWAVYEKIIGIYSSPIETAYNDLYDYAQANGYELENIFIHMKQDYTARYNWSGMDKFDLFDKVNGVIVDNSGVLTDKTDAAYNATAGDVAFGNNLYVGYGMPFDQMNFTIATYASGLNGHWQYWNGTSWVNLVVASDSTNNFIQNGQVSFVPPSDWKRTSVNNSRQKYFLRYSINSATTKPVLTKIIGDNWTNGAKARGWDKNSPTIINSGELVYNPTPPASATAKFRYQARATGYWAPTYVFVNPAYIVNGKRVWADFDAQRTVNDINAQGIDGVMFDSLGEGLSNGITDPPTNQESYSDFSDYTSNSWSTESLNQYSYIVDKIHQLAPGKKIGGNRSLLSYAMAGDFIVREYAAVAAIYGAAIYIAPYSATSPNYDNFLPANNPKGNFAYMMITDLLDHRTDSQGVFWDRANRGPIAALSAHYIASNDKTYFHYYSYGAYMYNETDDVIVFSPNTTQLSQNLVQDTTTATKYIYGNDFSAFPSTGSIRRVKIGNNVVVWSFNKIDNHTLSTTDPIYYSVNAGDIIKFVSQSADRLSNYSLGTGPSINNVYRWGNYFPAEFYDVGQPDSAGWNNGNRAIWTNGIWRRDFTKAIMLNLPANWNATKSQFETYLPAVNLGGSYRSLLADGTLGPTINSISLRTGEGAILIKSTGSGDTTPPAAPSGVAVN